MLPEVGCSSPLSINKVVDLPQPEGPNRPISFPEGISTSKSFTATTLVLAFLFSKTLVKCFNVIFITFLRTALIYFFCISILSYL